MKVTLVCLWAAAVSVAGAAPAPAITGLGPNPIDAGGPYFPLTITGSGFVNGSVAHWGPILLSTSWQNRSDQLVAQISPDLRLIANNYFLTVTNPDGKVSNQFAITVSPVLSSITPYAAVAGGGPADVTIKGIGFQPNLVLLLSSSAGPVTIVPRVIDSGTMTATIPAVALAEARTAAVQIVDSVYGGSSGLLVFEIRGAPVITGASPNPIDAGGPYFLLNISGSGFAPTAAVHWPGLATPLGTTYISPTQLQAAITPELRQLAGAFLITVSDSSTGATSNSFKEIVCPVLFSLSPATAPAGSDAVTITATGTGFTAATVLATAQTTLPTTYIDAATLKGILPAAVLRNPVGLPIQVTDTAGGGHSLPQTFTVSPATPGIATLLPNAVNAGSPAFTLTIVGSNFVAGTLVQWNGDPLPAMLVSATQLSVPVGPWLVRAPGTVTVTVLVPGAPPATSAFTIRPPAPVLSAIAPVSTAAGAASFTLTATVSNCSAGCSIEWNGARLPTTIVSETKVTAAVPASLLVTPGTALVRVLNADGAASNSASFVITPAAPALTSITPASMVAGDSIVTFTITGTNFLAGAVAQWNSTALATTFVNSSQLGATVPPDLLRGVDSAAVTVTNPGTGPSNALTVAIRLPGPVITALTPASLAAGGGPFTLQVNGRNFAAGCVMRWNGSPLLTTFASATQATATVPADRIAAPGEAAITLANPDGQESPPAAFTIFTPAPAIASLSPASASAGAAEFTLTVSGSGFQPGSKVTWNSTTLLTAFVSSTELQANVPAALVASSGFATIAIATPGVSALNTAVFAIGEPRPAATTAGIVNAATSQPAIAPGSLISIYGVNLAAAEASAPSLPLPKLLGGTVVSINGIAAPLLFVSPGQINAQVPLEIPPGDATLTVQAGTLASAPVPFAVVPVAPGIWPAGSAPVAVGQYISIYGTGQGMVDASEPFALPLAPVTAQVGAQQAQVSFAGMAPGMAGVLQVNLLVPPVDPGRHDLFITIGGVKSNAVPLWVQ